MKVFVEILLQWDGPIGHFVPGNTKYKDLRVLSFCRCVEMECLPPVGCELFFDIPDDHPFAHCDMANSTVKRIQWFDGGYPNEKSPASFVVNLDRLMMKEAPASQDELMKEVEWMEAMGFTWQERKRQ